jgi:hypothetical protein
MQWMYGDAKDASEKASPSAIMTNFQINRPCSIHAKTWPLTLKIQIMFENEVTRRIFDPKTGNNIATEKVK